MLLRTRTFFCFLLLILTTLFSYTTFAAEMRNIPILCYHNFNPTRPGSMNLTPEKFESQIKWLRDNGFTIVPLKEVVEYLQGNRQSLPDKPIVITVDDGWQSAYQYLFPIVKKYKIPVTLFVYPEVISQAKHKNNLSWDEIKQLEETGLFDVEGHTYSHPNFKQEKKHRSPESYEKFVQKELVNSKKVLEEKLGKKITLLAWPFGIYDDYLEQQAEKAGYVMSFSIDYRAANRNYRPMSQPRFMIINSQSEKTFEHIANRSGVKNN